MSDNNNRYQVHEESSLRIPPSSAPAFEKHFSVNELAEWWGLSERTIRRMFDSEPGVVVLERSETRFKRAYKTVRIPQSVAQRVYRKLKKAS
jgi:transcriptional regulator GlxA family with amidase domain